MAACGCLSHNGFLTKKGYAMALVVTDPQALTGAQRKVRLDSTVSVDATAKEAEADLSSSNKGSEGAPQVVIPGMGEVTDG